METYQFSSKKKLENLIHQWSDKGLYGTFMNLFEKKSLESVHQPTMLALVTGPWASYET